MAKSRAIANLGVSLTARTSKFMKGMSKARRATRGLTKAFGGLTRAAATLGGLGGIGGFSLIAKSSLTTIDALSKTSQKLGLTVEALQELQHAARLSGVQVRTFDMGLQRMTRRVAEAGKGTGEAKAAIAELGLVAERLAKMSPDQQFAAIADAMERVTDQGDRVRLGFKLFDSEGVALINTLRGGKAALDAAAASARLLGIVTTEQAEAVVEANDALTGMKMALVDVSNAITSAAAPDLKSLAEGITDLTIGLKNLDKETAGDLTNAAKWGTAAVGVGLFSRQLLALGSAFKTLALAPGIPGLVGRAGVATVGVLGFEQLQRGRLAAANAKEWGGHLRAVAEQQARIAKEAAAAAANTDGAADGAKRLADEAERTARAMADITKRTAELKRFGKGITERTRLPIERQRAIARQLSEAVNAGAITPETFKRAMFQGFLATRGEQKDLSPEDLAFRSIAGSTRGGKTPARNAELDELRNIGRTLANIHTALRTGIISP